ncbi:hypothetical protein HDU93_000299, partial [Gonapodya sp. JEL0774]
MPKLATFTILRERHTSRPRTNEEFIKNLPKDMRGRLIKAQDKKASGLYAQASKEFLR